MTTKFIDDVVAELTLAAESAPSLFEFEMAYQNRIACDQIRFAIRNVEPLATGPGAIRESCFQLTEAFARLEGVGRRFQRRSANPIISRSK